MTDEKHKLKIEIPKDLVEPRLRPLFEISSYFTSLMTHCESCKVIQKETATIYPHTVGIYGEVLDIYSYLLNVATFYPELESLESSLGEFKEYCNEGKCEEAYEVLERIKKEIREQLPSLKDKIKNI
ncbi:MAG: hypothetical protein ACE5J4_01185 [Candidatus Aenigmatarchaeota archaeon]